DTFIHLFVVCKQLAEIAHFVQPLLVVADSGLHQQTGDAILHLHHLAYQQVAVAQSSASIANGGGCHVAFWQEVTAQAVGDLAGIDSDRFSYWPQRWRAASADALPSPAAREAADDRKSSL